MSAASQAALVTGYQQIAKKLGLPGAQQAPIDFIAELMMWFHQSESWLLIVDNLDDIEVLNPLRLFTRGDMEKLSLFQTLLPENGPSKHTIITTRNKYADWIPAEGVEIPLPSCDEAIAMLFTLTGIQTYQESENEQAMKIVTELGYLPLAIEQAAAYIAQVCNKKLSTFLPRYKANRSTIHRRVSFGGRQYSESIATTWILSVTAVTERNPNAAILLKFLAYLAPDLILINFLKAGSSGVDDGLKQIIANEESFDEVLFMLEQFSLVKRETTKQGDGLVMHRLVQAFLQDEIQLHTSNESEVKHQWSNVIGLGNEAFPIPWGPTNMSRRTCREFQNQLLPILLACPMMKIDNIQALLERMG